MPFARLHRLQVTACKLILACFCAFSLYKSHSVILNSSLSSSIKGISAHEEIYSWRSLSISVYCRHVAKCGMSKKPGERFEGLNSVNSNLSRKIHLNICDFINQIWPNTHTICHFADPPSSESEQFSLLSLTSQVMTMRIACALVRPKNKIVLL